MKSVSPLIAATRQLLAGQILSRDDIIGAGKALIDESVQPELKRNFLLAWQERGEEPDEIANLAGFFRENARNPELDAFAPEAIDIVGTGGDKAGTFNISTTASIIVAAAGTPVIKHGNRSVTSKTGSADLLESIGIPLNADLPLLKKSMEVNRFAFLFAPGFHPAFKSIVPVRKALAAEGRQTIFNILGPLINPAKPAFQLLGVYREDLVQPIADTLTRVGIRSGLVVHSEIDGQSLDEITTLGHPKISPVGDYPDSSIEDLKSFIKTLPTGSLHDLKGGDASDNMEIFESILKNQANSTLMNTLWLNAGLALHIAGAAASVRSGFEKARETVVSGTASDWVEKTRKFFQDEA